MIDPIRLANEVYKIVVRKGSDGEEERKYYRFRGGRWYGGIATADCVGCNLKCKFCWSWRVRDKPHSVGFFCKPSTVAKRIISIALKRGYRYVRISGGEPTISWNHLLKVIEEVEKAGLLFILETNGILIGYHKEYARDLSKYGNVHVRVSLKGCTEDEFAFLTGADPSFFEYQLKALENLLDYNVSCNPAVMLSFSEEDNIKKLLERLREIDKVLIEEFEPEYVFLYPHVIELLRRHSLKPKRAYMPDNIPSELI